MLTAPTLPGFEPTTGTKERMTYTRRTPLGVGGVNTPGLFGIHAFPTDVFFFVLMLAGEVFGMFQILQYGAAATIFSFSIVVILIDLALAYGHHKFSVKGQFSVEKAIAHLSARDARNLASSSGIAAGDDFAAYVHAIEIKEKGHRFWSVVFGVLLVFMAAGKTIMFFEINGRSLDIPLFLMIAVYTVTCLIHLFVTGYVISGFWANWVFESQRKKYVLSGQQVNRSQERTIELDYHEGIHAGISVNAHAIKALEQSGQPLLDANGHPRLILVAHGILYDDDIRQFTNRVPNINAKSEIACKGLKLQLEILHSNPGGA